jgi:hypothetical protein
VKFGKNASETCAKFSEACGGEAVRKLCVFEWYKHFKEVKITNEENVHHFLQYQGYCSL